MNEKPQQWTRELAITARSLRLEDAEEVRAANQDLRRLWPPVRLEKEVGKGLGSGALLLRAMPAGALSMAAVLPGLDDRSRRIAFAPTREAGLTQVVSHEVV